MKINIRNFVIVWSISTLCVFLFPDRMIFLPLSFINGFLSAMFYPVFEL